MIMKYLPTTAILFSSLLTFVSALTYVNPADVQPEASYILTLTKDGTTYALQSDPKNVPTTLEITPDQVFSATQTDVQWRFPKGIPSTDRDGSGWVSSVATQNYLGWLPNLDPWLSTNIPDTQPFGIGWAVGQPDGSISLKVGGVDIGFGGDEDPGATWKISPVTSEVQPAPALRLRRRSELAKRRLD